MLPSSRKSSCYFRCLTCVVGLAFAFGCGGSASADRGTPVWGRVTIGGTPRAGVVVAFHPDRTGPGGGVIETGPDGRFAIGTHGEPGGLQPGHYKVTLSCRVGPDGKPVDDDKKAGDGIRQIVPAVYTSLETTPTAVNVSAAAGEINLDIPAR